MAHGIPASEPDTYWALPRTSLLERLETIGNGLSSEQAALRLKTFGFNTLTSSKQITPVAIFFKQFKDPLILILFFAVCIAIIVGEWTDALIVIAVITVTACLSFVQEYRATRAIQALLNRVETVTTVLRDEQLVTVPTNLIVPGDIISLSAGNLIPGDGVILETNACYVDQAALTGETYPVEKYAGITDANASLAERTNCVFRGTSVRNGTARALIVHTGMNTIYGQIAQQLELSPPETDFERGIRHFGYLLARVVLIFVILVFTLNLFSSKPIVDSLLFAVALAVGMAPELLPAVITITLSNGAKNLADQGVIVRRLNSIENFGTMDVLCTDKTGTLTAGVMQLNAAIGAEGEPCDQVGLYAFLNAKWQVGINNPMDTAIIEANAHREATTLNYYRVGEIPYDFTRKRLSIIVDHTEISAPLLITKGAVDSVLDICSHFQRDGESAGLDTDARDTLHNKFTEWSSSGYRVLGLATKPIALKERYTSADEYDLTFYGFLLFIDPPKPDIKATLADLSNLGVQVKIISGDSLEVTRYIAQQVDLPINGTLTGSQLRLMRDEALWQIAERTTLFVEVDPNQKERIIHALKKTGHVVGYLGDGINDAPALYAADVGISVVEAVDVAKETADIVLLERSLTVLHDGIVHGRKIFTNTLKYVLTTTSANFGNMLSMAILSFFLPFLPLLAKQILLNNFLSDIPGMAISNDNVDPDITRSPRRWDMRFITRFMVSFGLLSSAFDFITFGILLGIIRTVPAQFQTAWFIESLLTELAIALVVRTRMPLFKSRPGNLLIGSTLIVTIVALLLPYLPLNILFGFVPLPVHVMGLLILITVAYVIAAELTKIIFYRIVQT